MRILLHKNGPMPYVLGLQLLQNLIFILVKQPTFI
jgi:hypothetical protein